MLRSFLFRARCAKTNKNGKRNVGKYERQQELANTNTRHTRRCDFSGRIHSVCRCRRCFFVSIHIRDHKYLLLGFSDVNSLRQGNKFWFSFFSAIYYLPLCYITINMTTYAHPHTQYESTQSSILCNDNATPSHVDFSCGHRTTSIIRKGILCDGALSVCVT